MSGEERFAEVGDLEICWQEFGSPDDPVVLMIMGLGAQMILWPDEMCELIAARGYRVIRFDNRDSGRSTVLDGAPTGTIRSALAGDVAEGSYLLTDMASDSVGLLDALGIVSAHVVGASLGGMIAQTVAIEHPQRVRSLTSIMSTTGNPEVGGASPAGLEALTTAPPREREGYVATLVANRRMISSPGFEFDEERARRNAGLGWERGYHPEGTLRQTIAIIASGDRTVQLRALDVPTVVVHGEDDPLIDASGGVATAEAIPDAELVLVPGMGHDLPAGVWELVADAVVRNAERGERLTG